jgi:hypothetical protein
MTLTKNTQPDADGAVSAKRPTLRPVLHTSKTVTDPPEAARDAYERFASEWSKTSTEGLLFPSAALDFTLAALLQRCDELEHPAIVKRFALLPEFDARAPTLLRPMTLATLHCFIQYSAARRNTRRRLLSATLVKECTSQIAQMEKVIEHNLATTNSGALVVVAHLRKLRRQADLSHRLNGLADVYDDPANALVLRMDGNCYKPTDVATARTLAARALNGFNAEDHRLTFWSTQLTLSWNSLRTVYNEVRRGMFFLDWGYGAEKRFPRIGSFRGPARAKRKGANATLTPRPGVVNSGALSAANTVSDASLDPTG